MWQTDIASDGMIVKDEYQNRQKWFKIVHCGNTAKGLRNNDSGIIIIRAASYIFDEQFFFSSTELRTKTTYLDSVLAY